MDIVKKIDQIRQEKGWSVNKLASEAMLTQSTVCNMLNSGCEPKIATLKAICDAFGMTLSEFFYDNTNQTIDPHDLDMVNKYKKLSEREQSIVSELIEVLGDR